ncbi:hypothetical protein ACFE04_023996 [Oxalis oulophora]
MAKDGDNCGTIAPELVGEALQLFKDGISMTLSRWSVLKMAVEMKWGGHGSRRKAELLASNILSWFTQSREALNIDDLKAMLDDGMIYLNTMVEDGSTTEVAEILMLMHTECLEGNFQSIENLRAAATPQQHQSISYACSFCRFAIAYSSEGTSNGFKFNYSNPPAFRRDADNRESNSDDINTRVRVKLDNIIKGPHEEVQHHVS